MADPSVRPPYDPELKEILALMPSSDGLTREMLPMVRQIMNTTYTLEAIISVYPEITHEERIIPGPNGDIKLSIFHPSKRLAEGNPGIYWIHGGGMIAGNRFTGTLIPAEWVDKLNAVCVSVEYRYAPEYPGPIPVEDCYAGLEWVEKNAASLGIDPKKLIIAGQSAGGGLAAGTSLLIRDRGGPALLAQVLICPMLDDRNTSVSSKQYVTGGPWTKASNNLGWNCLLGDRTDISIYEAPARATDLSRLPPAFLDVGSAEIFRDEDVAFASLLWASGVQAELHVWPGGFHGFDMLAPTAALSQAAIKTRTAWIGRLLSTA
jgi:acetyl esterase/lipase